VDGIIFADNKYQPIRHGVLRAPGAHRIATHLRKQGYKIEVFDFYLDWTLDELKKILDNRITDKTLFVGFSCSLMFEGVDNFSGIRDYIREKYPHVAITVGGNKTLHKGFIDADYYLEGVGEAATDALVRFLTGQDKELIYQTVNGNKLLNGLTDYKLDSVKGINIAYQSDDYIGSDECLSLETARGCIFKCAFCDFPGIGKKKVDYLRDKQEVIEELIENYKRWGVTKYFIVEDTINDTEMKCNMLGEIGRELPFDITLMGYMRADLLVRRPETVQQLWDAGFRGMHFGIETFHPEAGKIIGKGMPAEKLKQGLTQIKNKFPGFHWTSTFIVGLPYESEEDVRKTVKWLIDSQVIDFWSFNPLMIPKVEPTIHHSYFTENYMMYGYKKMSAQDIEDARNTDKETSYGLKWWKHVMPWKNNHFNSSTAAKLASDINNMSNEHRKIDAWHAWALSALGDPLEDLVKMQYNHSFNGELYERLTQEYIDDYKSKKLLI